MKIDITGRQIDVTPALREFAEEKLGKLAKLLLEPIELLVDVDLVLFGQQRLLGLDDRGVVGAAAPVLHERQFGGAPGRIHAFTEKRNPLLGLEEFHQAVFDLLLRPQDRVLIGENQALQAGILHYKKKLPIFRKPKPPEPGAEEVTE